VVDAVTGGKSLQKQWKKFAVAHQLDFSLIQCDCGADFRFPSHCAVVHHWESPEGVWLPETLTHLKPKCRHGAKKSYGVWAMIAGPWSWRP